MSVPVFAKEALKGFPPNLLVQFRHFRAPKLDPFPEIDAWDGPWRDDVALEAVDRERTARLADVDVAVDVSGRDRVAFSGSSPVPVSGLPINRARPSGSGTRVTVRSGRGTEKLRLRLPSTVLREGDPHLGEWDVHMLMVDPVERLCWEAIQFWPQLDGSWSAGYGEASSGMIAWDMSTRWDPQSAPRGGVVAANVPVTPLLPRWDEITAGAIRHTLALVLPNYSPEPAVGWARGTDGGDPRSPVRAGDILRLTEERYHEIAATFPSGTPARVVLDCLRLFGMVAHDKRSRGDAASTEASVRLSMDRRWAALPDLGLSLTDFEIVQPTN